MAVIVQDHLYPCLGSTLACDITHGSNELRFHSLVFTVEFKSRTYSTPKHIPDARVRERGGKCESSGRDEMGYVLSGDIYDTMDAFTSGKVSPYGGSRKSCIADPNLSNQPCDGRGATLQTTFF